MFEGIMSKFGYHKINFVSGDGWRKLSEREEKIMNRINLAKANKKDLFIDYVKKTDNQKFYAIVNKRKKCVLEV